MNIIKTFDPLKARIVDEETAKTLHLNKKIPGIILHLPGQNLRLLHSSSIRVFEDFNKTNLIGFGFLAYEDSPEFKGTIVDLHLNYNVPVRLDLETDASRTLYVLYTPEQSNASEVLDAVLDNTNSMDNISSSVVMEFTIEKENLCL